MHNADQRVARTSSYTWLIRPAVGRYTSVYVADWVDSEVILYEMNWYRVELSSRHSCMSKLAT